MASLVDRKMVVMGLVAIFALAIVATIFLTSLSKSANIKSNPFNLFFVKSDSSSSPPHPPSNGFVGNNKNIKTFTLVADEFGFNGSSSGPLIKVNKNDIVKIAFINAGAMSHTFGIGKPSKFTMSLMKNISGLSTEEKIRHVPYDVLAKMPCPGCKPEFEEAHIKTFVNPGDMVVTTFKASKSGNFKYFCMVRGHIWLGMNGDLVVTDPGSSAMSKGNGVSA